MMERSLDGRNVWDQSAHPTVRSRVAVTRSNRGPFCEGNLGCNRDSRWLLGETKRQYVHCLPQLGTAFRGRRLNLGKTGLWIEAESITYFDEFTIRLRITAAECRFRPRFDKSASGR